MSRKMVIMIPFITVQKPYTTKAIHEDKSSVAAFAYPWTHNRFALPIKFVVKLQ